MTQRLDRTLQRQLQRVREDAVVAAIVLVRVAPDTGAGETAALLDDVLVGAKTRTSSGALRSARALPRVGVCLIEATPPFILALAGDERVAFLSATTIGGFSFE